MREKLIDKLVFTSVDTKAISARPYGCGFASAIKFPISIMPDILLRVIALIIMADISLSLSGAASGFNHLLFLLLSVRQISAVRF
ncbi:MAG: hypothetical protein ACI9ES_000494 [Oceanospirillaceae bacterium]|jgi:hypothetical protein